MRKNVFIAFLCVLFLSACQQEEWFTSEELKDNQVVFKLQCAEFEDENGLNRNGLERNVPYDRVEFCVLLSKECMMPLHRNFVSKDCRKVNTLCQ